jgi:glycosyltransferase involved in cell wall biosynthesis
LGLDDNTFLFGSVARLSATKNPTFQIDLLLKLRQLGVNAQLLLVGNGELHSDLLHRVEQFEVQNFVHFTGNVENPQAYLCALDAFTLPSISEGLPFSMVEASACGLMCLVSDSVRFKSSDFPNVIPLSIQNSDVWVAKLISEYNDFKMGESDRLALGQKFLPQEYDQKYMASVLSEIYSQKTK